MEYKTRSILILSLIVVVTVVVAMSVNLNGSITGAVVLEECNCFEDIDCNDNNPETEDICLYKESCEASLCVNKEKDN